MTEIYTKFKKLDEIEHVLLRPGRYLGSTSPHETVTYLINNGKIEYRAVKYNPAFVKMFDEVISNSVDFSKKPEGKHLNKIEVTINQLTGEISVWDNGGIPVVVHPEYDQYIPDFIFGELRSGTNFDDDEESISTGQNGEGSSLVNIFSKRFMVETADGKKKFTRIYSNNNRDRSTIKIETTKLKFTKISYIPDYERLKVELDKDHYDKLVRRVWEIAACAPHIEIKLNGYYVNCKSFEDFIKMFSKEYVYIDLGKWKLGFAHSKDDGFKHISFVNTTNTYNGGTHIDYIMNMVVDKIRDHIEKKTKQKVKPSDIKNHFMMFVDATINNPRYDSQTKENLITEVRDYGSVLVLPEKFINKIINSSIVKEIIEWAENKKKLEELLALKNKQKDNQKASLKHIIKYEPATEKVDRKNCTLFICEGDSALNPLMSARDPKKHGLFPLKGKPLNVRDVKIADLLKNDELFNLIKILGLEIGVKAKIEDLRYGRLVVAPDQDYDGHHIFGLCLNLFQTLWPELLTQKFIHKLETPLIKVDMGKTSYEFFEKAEFDAWALKQTKSFKSKYLKGLGGNSTESFKRFMFEEKYMTPYTIQSEQDILALDIAFDKGDGAADRRKQWLYG